MIKTEHSQALKPSGIPWIGDIPEAWEVGRIKNYVNFNPKYSETLSDNASVSFAPMECLKNDSLTPQEAILINVKGGYTYFADEDLILAKVTPCFENGNIAIAKNLLNGIGFGSSELFVLRCTNCYNRFLFYFLQNTTFKQLAVAAMYGTGGLQRVSPSFLQNYKYGVPPLPEQEAIARYLDEKCALVDATVEKEKLAIAKLKEYKQAVITEAVTKGLNPHAPLKPSGIPWIGDIPEAWERTKLKRLLEIPITDGPHETPLFIDEGIPFISAEAIKNNTVNFNLKRGYISKEEHLRFTKKCKPKVHDIFMVKSGATTGNIALVETTEEFSIWSPLALMRSNKERLYYKYLFYYLQSHLFKKQVEQFWSYGTQQNIGMEVLGNLFLAYPPLAEQEAIARYLDEKCSQVEGVIAQKEAIIEKLNDYKKSLIYECVTGKKKVPTL